MLNQIKKLLNELLFLTKIQKKRLLESLGSLSDAELKDIYAVFSGIRDREDEFIKKIYHNSPLVVAQSEALIQSFQREISTEPTLAGKIMALDKFSRMFDKLK